jgi:uncharacterized membrane protein
MNLDDLFGYKDQVMLYSLAAVAVLAGVSKFVYPQLWMGFEPAWLTSILPLSSTQFVYATGAIETVLGVLLAIRWRTWQVATVVTVWLAGITITVASMCIWTIALRDFGLTALSYSVAANEYSDAGLREELS